MQITSLIFGILKKIYANILVVSGDDIMKKGAFTGGIESILHYLVRMKIYTILKIYRESQLV